MVRYDAIRRILRHERAPFRPYCFEDPRGLQREPGMEGCIRVRGKGHQDEGITISGYTVASLHADTLNTKSAHYLLYEALQFAGLHALDPDGFFREQELARQESFSRHYPLYRVSGRFGDSVFFSASGNPNPYNIDIFEIDLRCGRGDEVLSTDKQRGFLRWAFVYGPFPVDSPRCSVVSKYMGQEYELYRGTWFREVNEDDRPEIIAVSVQPALDAVHGEGDWVVIDPARKHSADGESSYTDVEARLTYSFPRRPLSNDAILALEVDTDSTLKVSVRLHDGEKSIHRYLLPISGGIRQMLAFSRVGFEGSQDFDGFDGLTLIVHTEDMLASANVRVRSIIHAANQYEFYQAAKGSDALMVLAK